MIPTQASPSPIVVPTKERIGITGLPSPAPYSASPYERAFADAAIPPLAAKGGRSTPASIVLQRGSQPRLPPPSLFQRGSPVVQQQSPVPFSPAVQRAPAAYLQQFTPVQSRTSSPSVSIQEDEKETEDLEPIPFINKLIDPDTQNSRSIPVFYLAYTSNLDGFAGNLDLEHLSPQKKLLLDIFILNESDVDPNFTSIESTFFENVSGFTDEHSHCFTKEGGMTCCRVFNSKGYRCQSIGHPYTLLELDPDNRLQALQAKIPIFLYNNKMTTRAAKELAPTDAVLGDGPFSHEQSTFHLCQEHMVMFAYYYQKQTIYFENNTFILDELYDKIERAATQGLLETVSTAASAVSSILVDKLLNGVSNFETAYSGILKIGETGAKLATDDGSVIFNAVKWLIENIIPYAHIFRYMAVSDGFIKMINFITDWLSMTSVQFQTSGKIVQLTRFLNMVRVLKIQPTPIVQIIEAQLQQPLVVPEPKLVPIPARQIADIARQANEAHVPFILQEVNTAKQEIIFMIRAQLEQAKQEMRDEMWGHMSRERRSIETAQEETLERLREDVHLEIESAALSSLGTEIEALKQDLVQFIKDRLSELAAQKGYSPQWMSSENPFDNEPVPDAVKEFEEEFDLARDSDSENE